jgi:hypothetical protein
MSGIDYTSVVTQAAQNAGIPASLALAVMQAESSGNPNAVSSAGAVGLFQLMPSSFPGVNINDPTTNIDTGVGYLAQLLNQYDGNVALALAAYNAGPGNVAQYGGIPPFSETQSYVASILSTLGLTQDSTVGDLTTNATSSAEDAVSSAVQSVSDAITGVDPTTLAVVGGIGLVGAILLLK